MCKAIELVGSWFIDSLEYPCKRTVVPTLATQYEERLDSMKKNLICLHWLRCKMSVTHTIFLSPSAIARASSHLFVAMHSTTKIRDLGEIEFTSPAAGAVLGTLGGHDKSNLMHALSRPTTTCFPHLDLPPWRQLTPLCYFNLYKNVATSRERS